MDAAFPHRPDDPDGSRRRAVAARDAAASFVYAVRTTGVYCRPSCPSRAARPENVAFHATPADAEAAGFRACKRCRPNEVAGGGRHVEAVARACRLIESADALPSLDALAAEAGLSAFHFHRLFRTATGVTPKRYADGVRAAAPPRGGGSVTEAVYGAGFNAASRFYETSAARLGMTPTALRAGGAGVTMRFAVGECSLGSILVAATERGISAILIGDDPDALARDLQDQFPKAAIVGGDAAFEATVAAVVGFVEAPRGTLDLPLDITGTAFQQRVWEALRRLPPGTTATYAAVAAAIGQPRAFRAVATACAANRIAVAIPCHRVIHSDGSISGYRWGVERKRRLIEREADAEARG